MSEAIELAIRDLLLTEGDSDRVAQSLYRRLTEDAPNRKERAEFLNYLIHSGYYSEAFEIYRHWFKTSFPIPLTPFCHLLYLSGFKPGKIFLDQLFKLNEVSANENKVRTFPPWEDLDFRFVEIKKNIANELLEKNQQKRLRDFEKLEYLRINRMIAEEEKYLDELIALYPEEASLISDKKNFKQRWAREVIAEKALKTFNDSAGHDDPVFTQDEKIAGEKLTQVFLKLAKEKPELAYLLSIGLYFLDLYSNAILVLNSAPISRETDWFSVELLLKSRRYAECLDACYQIENRYTDDPETTFGATYYRAQALYGLGQSTTAKDLLRSLVGIRPSYRSAHSLLLKWGS